MADLSCWLRSPNVHAAIHRIALTNCNAPVTAVKRPHLYPDYVAKAAPASRAFRAPLGLAMETWARYLPKGITMKSIRSSIAKALVVASLSAVSASVLAASTSVFPSEAAGNDVAQPDNGQSYADTHDAKDARSNGSAIPLQLLENDTGMPDNGQSYADTHDAKDARSDSSAIPLQLLENDTGMPDNGQSYADLHKAQDGR